MTADLSRQTREARANPEQEASAIRSFVYSMWGHAGDERVRPVLAALDALASRVNALKKERDEVYAVNAANANDRARAFEAERDALAARVDALQEALRERDHAFEVAAARMMQLLCEFRPEGHPDNWDPADAHEEIRESHIEMAKALQRNWEKTGNSARAVLASAVPAEGENS